MQVLNFGSMNYDYVYKMDHIILPGETQASGSREVFCGGKGLNQSIAVAKAGIPVYHAGTVGADGDQLLAVCRENGVDTSYIQKVEGPGGHTVIQVDKSAQNSIILFGGTNRRQSREHINQVLENFAKGDVLLLQNEINLLDYIIDQAFAKEMTIILNPSPFDENLKKCDMSKISIFLLNEVEGAQISGTEDPDAILEYMLRTYPFAKVVLTLGKDGSVYQGDGMRIKQEIFPVQAVDTTGAGDTFTGYFIAGLLKGMEPESILKMCSMASALAVSKAGAAASIPAMAEVAAAVKKYM